MAYNQKMYDLVNKHPHKTTSFFIVVVFTLSFVSIGTISIIPVLFAALFLSLTQDKLSWSISKRQQIIFLSWSIVGGSFIVSLILSFHSHIVIDKLTWWGFLVTALLSAATMGALIWTIYTTQRDRSDDLKRRKEEQPKRVTSTITEETTEEGKKRTIIHVWNGSAMPIFDVRVGFNVASKDCSNNHFKKVSSIPAGGSRSFSLSQDEASTAMRLGIINSVPPIVFKDGGGDYWHRSLSGDFYEIRRYYDPEISYERAEEEWEDNLRAMVSYPKNDITSDSPHQNN